MFNTNNKKKTLKFNFKKFKPFLYFCYLLAFINIFQINNRNKKVKTYIQVTLKKTVIIFQQTSGNKNNKCTC